VPQKENSELEKLITSSKVLNSFSAVRALKKAGYQIALVSSASAKQVNDILLKTGNEQLFEQIVTSDDIDRAQTKETGYQLSLKKMNITPDSCLALVGSVKELELVQLSNSHAAIISEFTQLSKSELLSYNLPIFDNITQIFMILSYSD
jgi:phosphoglycolate phosphatase-like HAD superfamily hydrolase